jgi:hypothetical protein
MKNGNFAWLFMALLIFLLGVPIADDIEAIGQPVARALTFSCLLGIGVISLKGGGKSYQLGMFFAAAGIGLSVVATQTDSPIAIHSSFYSIMGFLLTAIIFTFKRIATDSEISANRIIGAIGVYLLLGVLWAVAYTLVELNWPNSFTGFEVGTGARWDSEWLYFSFVTMGYGDIAPVSAIARTLAYMQAILGQFYIAILVAGLVSAYISQKNREA